VRVPLALLGVALAIPAVAVGAGAAAGDPGGERPPGHLVVRPLDPSASATTGMLTLSVPGELSLSPAELSAAGDHLASQGTLSDISVTDQREGSPGWTVTASVSDFAGSQTSINGYNLGCRPVVVSQDPGPSVVAGPPVPPASAEYPETTPDDPDVGMEAARVLADAPPGSGLGTTILGAECTLVIPTSTPPDHYHAVLTITVI